MINNDRNKAFTLVELLVTIGIVALLLSITIPAMLKGKSKAKSIDCQNNLRQLGIGLALFVENNQQYPLAVNPGFYTQKNENHLQHWSAAIWVNGLGNPANEAFQAETKSLFKCASSKKPKEWPERKGWSDYGYNNFGNGNENSSVGLGLLEIKDDLHIPVPENQVKAPSRTYAIGDGIKGEKSNLEDGSSELRKGLLPYNSPETTVSRLNKRHTGNINILFADGHAEAKHIVNVFTEDEGWARE